MRLVLVAVLGATCITVSFCFPARANAMLSCSSFQLSAGLLSLTSPAAAITSAASPRVPSCVELDDCEWFLAAATRHLFGRLLVASIPYRFPTGNKAEILEKVFELDSVRRL
jgi:hypothetical protein